MYVCMYVCIYVCLYVCMKKLRRRKLHLERGAFAFIWEEPLKEFSDELIRHRASKNDFRYQEMDSLLLWSMQHAITIYDFDQPIGSRNHDC